MSLEVGYGTLRLPSWHPIVHFAPSDLRWHFDVLVVRLRFKRFIMTACLVGLSHRERCQAESTYHCGMHLQELSILIIIEMQYPFLRFHDILSGFLNLAMIMFYTLGDNAIQELIFLNVEG